MKKFIYIAMAMMLAVSMIGTPGAMAMLDPGIEKEAPSICGLPSRTPDPDNDRVVTLSCKKYQACHLEVVDGRVWCVAD